MCGAALRAALGELLGRTAMRAILFLSGAVTLALTAAPAIAELPSSPAELAQTRALNQSAATGTFTSPLVLNGQARAQTSTDVVGGEAEAKSNLNPENFVVLKDVDPEHLGGVSVEDETGVAIGRVTDVTLARDGTAAEISIQLNDGRRVRVSQAALRYNPNDRVLLTRVDLGALRALASAEDTGE